MEEGENIYNEKEVKKKEIEWRWRNHLIKRNIEVGKNWDRKTRFTKKEPQEKSPTSRAKRRRIAETFFGNILLVSQKYTVQRPKEKY
jgi:hypothetical protein